MPERWIKRRAHSRRGRTGARIAVAAAWVLVASTDGKGAKQTYRRTCPMCGSPIISVRMRRGGWAHFEGAQGLTRIKHPCMHLGEGLGRRRAEGMDDLFDAAS